MVQYAICARRESESLVEIGRGLLAAVLRDVSDPVVILGDQNIRPYVADLDGGMARATRLIDLGEEQKTLESAAQVYQWLGDHKVTRDTLLVVVGGGVMTDLGGYVAATYLRGMSWIAVSTSLLGQVDAAIGGKVGINAAWGKNLIGAFHLPSRVVIDVDTLRTLPLPEWRAGAGEIIKSALIAGGPLYDVLTRSLPVLGEVSEIWETIIRETARIKVDVVNEDLYEKGPRLFLNFGHTIGHALETHLGYGRMKHGEAVGVGSLVALALSETVLGLDPGVRREVTRWLKAWELPTAVSGVFLDSLWDIMQQDKKARAFGLQWILLEEIGKPKIIKDVPKNVVQTAWDAVMDSARARS